MAAVISLVLCVLHVTSSHCLAPVSSRKHGAMKLLTRGSVSSCAGGVCANRTDILRNLVGDKMFSEARKWGDVTQEPLSNTPGASSFQAVTSVNLSALESALILSHSIGHRDRAYAALNCARTQVLAWRNVTRGKDLFVTGLGSFDIHAVYAQKLSKLQADRHYSSSFFSSHIAPFHDSIQAIFDNLSNATNLTSPNTSHQDAFAMLAESNDTLKSISQKLQSVNGLGCMPKEMATGVAKVWALVQRAKSRHCLDVLFWPWEKMIFTPTQLTVAGYFQAAKSPALYEEVFGGSHTQLRNHLIRFQRSWCDPALEADFQEAKAACETVPWPEDGDALRPPLLLKRLREDLEIRDRVRMWGNDTKYDHLSPVADGEVGEGGLQMQVLRSSHRIREAGAALSNCLGTSHADDVKGKLIVLVALVDTTRADRRHPQGVVLAVACFSVMPADAWSTMPLLSCNRAADNATKAHFDTFLPSLTRAQLLGLYGVAPGVWQFGGGLSGECFNDRDWLIQMGRALLNATTLHAVTVWTNATRVCGIQAHYYVQQGTNRTILDAPRHGPSRGKEECVSQVRIALGSDRQHFAFVSGSTCSSTVGGRFIGQLRFHIGSEGQRNATTITAGSDQPLQREFWRSSEIPTGFEVVGFRGRVEDGSKGVTALSVVYRERSVGEPSARRQAGTKRKLSCEEAGEEEREMRKRRRKRGRKTQLKDAK